MTFKKLGRFAVIATTLAWMAVGGIYFLIMFYLIK